MFCFASPRPATLRDVRVLGREHAVERLEQQDLGAEPAVGGGDLGAGRAGADDRDAASGSSSSAHAPSVPITRPPNCVPGIGFGTEPVARMTHFVASISVPSKLPPTLTLPSSVTEPKPSMYVDLVLLEQSADAAGERLDDLLAALADLRRSRRERPSTLMPKSPASSISVSTSADAQHRLRRDAGVVQAAAADRVLLDHGGLHPELGGADRGDVAAGSGADDDAVVGRIRAWAPQASGARSCSASGSGAERCAS